MPTRKDRRGVAEAIRILERLERDGPPENLRHEVQLDLAQFHLFLGDLDAAAARLKRLEGVDLPEPLATGQGDRFGISYARLVQDLQDARAERTHKGR